MKKLIVSLIILGALTGLWFWAKSQGSVFAQQGKTATGSPGRVEVPVTASGHARERQLIQIKAEASGTIIKLHVVEGDLVKPNALLLEIDQEEEQRNVDQAQASLDQATEQLALAELNHIQASEDLDYNNQKAQANLDLAQARFDNADHEYTFYKDLYENNSANFREYDRATTEYFSRRAELTGAKLDLERAKTTGPRNIEKAAREIAASQARRRSAEYRLSDTQRRLNKTKVINSYNSECRVVRIYISEGEIAVGAQTTVGSTTLIELADLSAMEVTAKVDETDIASVVDLQQAGLTEREASQPTVLWPDEEELRYSDQVRVEFDALPGTVFVGYIIEVAEKPQSVAQIISYDVRIRLDPGPDVDHVRLGMQSTIDFAPQFEEGLLVPYEAVRKIGGKEYVVHLPNTTDPMGEPTERPVEVGLTDGESVIIRQGLTEAEVFYIELPRQVGRG